MVTLDLSLNELLLLKQLIEFYRPNPEQFDNILKIIVNECDDLERRHQEFLDLINKGLF